MQTYTKFIFPELPKNAVVNINDQDIDQHQEEIINLAVTQHLQTIINADDINHNDSQEPQEQIATNLQDIDAIKFAAYNKGLEDAKIQYESIMNDLKVKHDFCDLLQRQLLKITASTDISGEISNLASRIMTAIVKKLHLIVPADFSQILRLELLDITKKFYKSGQIKIIIHSEKSELCKNILHLEELPIELKSNIQIITDDAIGVNDCVVEWGDSYLKYDHSNIDEEVVRIIEQFSNNQITSEK